MKEPRFVTREIVDALHRLSLEEHGGQDGLRNEHGLESALAQPHHVFTYANGDLAALAAAYDGDKRTAVLTALYFLELNGVDTTSFTDAELYDAMIGIAEKRFDKASLAEIFRRGLPA